LRGIKLTHGKAVGPKKPFMREHIVQFMKAATVGSLLDWRVALPLALCYQQLLRGAECFDLCGANVVRQPDCFVVEVESAKNNPDGFSFKVPIDPFRPSCVGQFMADFIVKARIILGDKNSFFAFKVSQVKGILKAVPAKKVGSFTMHAACKRLIAAVGLDPTSYASHSCKRGGALAAMEAGLSQVQIQDLGRWASASMVGRYAGGDSDVREAASEVIRI
jgi:hypothetical protein